MRTYKCTHIGFVTCCYTLTQSHVVTMCVKHKLLHKDVITFLTHRPTNMNTNWFNHILLQTYPNTIYNHRNVHMYKYTNTSKYNMNKEIAQTYKYTNIHLNTHKSKQT